MSEYIITSEQLIEVFDKLHSWDFPEWLHEFVYTRRLFCPKLLEIVRCRDCEYYRDGKMNGRRYSEPYCGAIGELSFGAVFEVTEDDFCAWAERKVDDAD